MEIFTNEHDKEMPKEIYVSLERGQEINDKLYNKNSIMVQYHKTIKFQKIHNKIIERQLQIRMIKKYLNKGK